MDQAEIREALPIVVVLEETETVDFTDVGVEEPKVYANGTVT